MIKARYQITLASAIALLGASAGALLAQPRSHTSAVDVAVADLRAIGSIPEGDGNDFVQRVTVHHERLDVGSAQLYWRTKPYAPGADYLPLTDRLGVETPRRVDLHDLTALRAGRLGAAASSIDPEVVRGRVVVLLPPHRDDLAPTYELDPYRAALAQYHTAAVIMIASLELVPRSLLEQLQSGDWIGTSSDGSPHPPILLVTRIVANGLRGGTREIALKYRTVRTEGTHENIVVRIGGNNEQPLHPHVLVTLNADAAAAEASLEQFVALVKDLQERPGLEGRPLVLMWGANRRAIDEGVAQLHARRADYPTQPYARLDVGAITGATVQGELSFGEASSTDGTLLKLHCAPTAHSAVRLLADIASGLAASDSRQVPSMCE